MLNHPLLWALIFPIGISWFCFHKMNKPPVRKHYGMWDLDIEPLIRLLWAIPLFVSWIIYLIVALILK